MQGRVRGSVKYGVRRMAEGLRRSHTYLSKLELLLNIRHCSLALEADERS